MTTQNPAAPTYAAATWSPNDVLDLAPHMSYSEAEAWLAQNEKYVQEAMIRAGWDAIECLLPTPTER